jgi:three-Cys-motif partner protein
MSAERDFSAPPARVPARAADADQSPQYWADYSNLQRVKHDLIRKYLGGWFPKLGNWAGRVLYIDTHAGRGTHLTGDLGSPLIALNTLLDHSYRDQLLARSEFRFAFIERDASNCEALVQELRAVQIPARVRVQAVTGDAFTELERLLTFLAGQGQQMAPAFIFVDPYGFKVPGSILRRLFKAGRTELFVNVIWRELDMAIAQARSGHAGFVRLLDDVFDGDRWRQIDSDNFDERADQAANAYAEIVGAAWPTYIRMLGDNGATRYLLLHLSDHEAGRDWMKDCMWEVCPDGGFYARKTTNRAQQVLIEREPDLRPLQAWVLDRLGEGPKRWQELQDAVRPEVWRVPQLNGMVRDLRKAGTITASDYRKFVPAANPLLSLPQAETPENR